MKYLATQWSNARGSVGGTTYSQNRGGLYAKSRAKPVQPNTAPQLNCQGACKAVSQAWSASLTQTQRNGWILYGQTNPVTNSLGNSVILAGNMMFNRVNIPLFMAGGYPAMQLTAPGAVSLLVPFVIDSATAVAKGTTLGGTGLISWKLDFSVTMMTTDYLFLYITQPITAGRQPAHVQQRGVYAGLLGTLGSVSSPMSFTLADAWPLNRASGTSWMLRGYWIRGANLSSYAFLQGSTS